MIQIQTHNFGEWMQSDDELIEYNNMVCFIDITHGFRERIQGRECFCIW